MSKIRSKDRDAVIPRIVKVPILLIIRRCQRPLPSAKTIDGVTQFARGIGRRFGIAVALRGVQDAA